MDEHGYIYHESEKKVTETDSARLDGYLRAKAEYDRVRRLLDERAKRDAAVLGVPRPKEDT